MKKAIDYQAELQRLLKRKAELEAMIQQCTDPIALSAIRSDYRAVRDDLAGFYDDEPKEVKP